MYSPVMVEDQGHELADVVCEKSSLPARRRLHGLAEPPMPEIDFQETWTALTAWANENLAEGGIGMVAPDLGAGQEDQDFVRQARFLLHHRVWTCNGIS